jgi:uncharacterized membrane protein
VTPLHVLAGVLGILSGTVALSAVKGSRLHRGSGKVFVYAMLALSSTGALIAALQPRVVAVNVIAGSLTFYLVLTALLAVRRPVLQFHWTDGAAMLMALMIGLAAIKFGVDAAASPRRGERLLAAPSFLFSFVALLAAVGDARLLLGRRLQGAGRLARHLWRMCFAFFIAVASFFLGPPQRLPPLLRGSPLLPIPVLAVLLILVYWLVRLKLGRGPVVGLTRTPEAT